VDCVAQNGDLVLNFLKDKTRRYDVPEYNH